MAANFDQRPWKRFLDDELFPVRRRWYPVGLADLPGIIREAEAASSPVKACGSHWAPCDAAVNAGGTVVESNDDDAARPGGKFNQPLHNVVGKNGCLTNAAVKFLRGANASFDGVTAIPLQKRPDFVEGDAVLVDRGSIPFTLVHVEAGMKVYELYSMLDAGDDGSESLTAFIPDRAGPWAPITLGGSGGQTIGGVISTATHGGDVHLPPIADSIQALHLVAANGRQHWIERALDDGTRLTDNQKLRRTFGEIDIHRDDDTFRAAMVSAGRLGVIYSVVLRAVRQYALAQKTETKTWDETKALLLQHFPKQTTPGSNPKNLVVFADRFLQVIVNPQGRPKDRGVHSCFVTTRTTQALSAGSKTDEARQQRAGGNEGKSASFGKSCAMDILCRNASDHALGVWLDPLVAFVADPLYRAAKATAQAVTAAIEVAVGAALVESVGGIVPLATPLIAAFTDALAVVGGLSIGAEALGFDDFTEKFSSIELMLKGLDLTPFLHDEVEAAREALRVARIFKDVLEHRDGRTFGGLIAELCNQCVANDLLEYVRAVSEALIGAGKPDDMTAISYAVMDGHDYDDAGCQTRGVSLEAFLDAHSETDLNDGRGLQRDVFRFVEGVFDRLDKLQNGGLPRSGGMKKAFGGYLALRFMARSDSFLGMQRHRVTCSLELSGLGGCTGNADMMSEIQELAVASGATLHWGQANDAVDVAAVEQTYPDIEKWRDVLSAVSDNGRLPTFSTPFTRKKGLEVLRPKVGRFFVFPANGVAGENGSIFWDSRANPPGTIAKLTVERPGEPAVSRTLSSLNGTEHLVIPPGVSKFTYVVEHAAAIEGTSQTRTYTDQTIESVRGFSAADAVFHREELSAARDVDGQQQFAVLWRFMGGEWSTNLRVASMAVTFAGDETRGFWEVQNAGTIIRQVFDAAPHLTLSDRPYLAGDWLFVFRTRPFSGVSGPAPTLRVDFELTSDPLPLP